MNDLPIRQDIQFVVGDDFSMPLQLYTPTSGYSFDSYFTTTSGVIPFEVSNGDPINGVVSLFLGHDVSDTVPAGVYAWQFSFSDLNGLRTTWAQGLCTVIADA